MGAKQSSSSTTPSSETASEWLPSSSCTRHIQAARSDDTCMVKIAANAHFDINYKPTLQTIYSDKDTILYQSFSYDCQGKQLPAGIFCILQKSSTTLKSLTLSNLPSDCRVCIYDLFNKLQLDQYGQLEHVNFSRMYKDECYIRFSDGLTLPISTTHLTFYGIGLVTVPLTISTLSSLTHLSLANNIITQINSLVDSESLRNLISLDVAENLLTVIPNEIDNFADLKVLNLSHNCIKKTVPDSIGSLCGLTELLLQWNRLEGVPTDAIMGLKSLQVLDLSHNKLRKVARDLCFHPSLTSLNLSGNDGLAFQQTDNTSLDPSPLQELDISSTSICFLPSFLSELPALRIIDCADNDVSNIDIIINVQNLQKANFRSNCIIDCSKVVCYLQTSSTTQLKYLDLAHNGFTTDANDDSMQINGTLVLLHTCHDAPHQHVTARRLSNKASSQHERIQWLCCL